MNPMQVARHQRVENILSSLKKHDYLTRSQLQTLHDLKSDRNASRVLSALSKYVDSFFHGHEKVYHLNKRGREFVGHNVIRKKTMNAQHFLLRNQLFIALKRPATWESEVKITVGNTSIIADAKYSVKGVPVFVEVDISQPMHKNKQKIEKYKKFRELTDQPFHLVWVTELESRRPKLESLMLGLTGKVFTAQEIK